MGGDTRLVAAHEFFRKGKANAEGWSLLIAKGRGWESAYRVSAKSLTLKIW